MVGWILRRAASTGAASTLLSLLMLLGVILSVPPKRPPAPPPAPPTLGAAPPPLAWAADNRIMQALDPAAETLCDDPRIRGLTLSPFDEGGGCKIDRPVSVASIAGVRFAPVAVARCKLARRLADWIEQDLQPQARLAMGAPVARITHVSAYVCRRRNGVETAKLSFHATGAALDIAGMELADGRRLAVKADWGGDGPEGAAGDRFWRAVWNSACGPFGTVLGPQSDVHHHDHLHLDVAPRRNAYCR